jgi:hypothetical protein
MIFEISLKKKPRKLRAESVHSLVEKIVASEKLMGMVRRALPFDLVIALADLGLSPHDASRTALELIKRDTRESTLAGNPDPIDRHLFPPDPKQEPAEFPYDAMTIAGMEPGNKGHKRGLTNSVDIYKNQPGVGAGKGIQRKSAPHMKYGSDKGWSKSLGQFDLPELPEAKRFRTR